MALPDEQFVEVSDKQNGADDMTDYDRKAMTRRILLKLDVR